MWDSKRNRGDAHITLPILLRLCSRALENPSLERAWSSVLEGTERLLEATGPITNIRGKQLGSRLYLWMITPGGTNWTYQMVEPW
jgi:hypothetical protein